jgi:dTDP-4-amino-4,6-dideoxygalactose transaminase
VKEDLTHLAILSAVPEFVDPVYVGRPNIGDWNNLRERLEKILESRRLTNQGPFVREFEEAIARLIGVKHCIATCNGTTAIQIAARALDLSGEVIVPSFTFVATPHALQWLGITPVFCDIDPLSHSIDPDCVEQLITSRTSGIVGVHLWGRACEVKALSKVAEKHGLRLFFDAAHALSCSYRGRMIGSFGELEVFSFHATKLVNTFEGGIVATNDNRLARRARLMGNQGFNGSDEAISLGINAKMNEVSAAMGLTGLESLEQFVAANHRNYLQYRKDLAGLPGVRLFEHNQEERCNYQYIVAEIEESEAQITRDQLQEILWAENIFARRYFYPGCHRMEPYRSNSLSRTFSLPETERLSDRVLVLPNDPTMSVKDISAICSIIRLAVTQGRELATLLAERVGDEIATKAFA